MYLYWNLDIIIFVKKEEKRGDREKGNGKSEERSPWFGVQ